MGDAADRIDHELGRPDGAGDLGAGGGRSEIGIGKARKFGHVFGADPGMRHSASEGCS
jgi:hypothetical protein